MSTAIHRIIFFGQDIHKFCLGISMQHLLVAAAGFIVSDRDTQHPDKKGLACGEII
ncbi:MAG: hypothetical protein RIE73_17895 [Coleofasciculus sp. C1-SOL-03]|uniref:hypothetical protein n=1 Tax=Coleofasciculus sp. C1-SOL-03 TaxID=3069522 RepID=UPI0032F291DE